MARTYRRVYSPDKSHHRNAIPYKRGNKPIVICKGGIEITIEEDDRYQVTVINNLKSLSKWQKTTKESSPLWMQS